ncbi:MAG: hypothetical protein FWC13_08845 [Oscillospiraceae bacterium]|nr:hypothetical protein [Oscillospiraceae bacterium]
MKKAKKDKFIFMSLALAFLLMIGLPALAGTVQAVSGPAGITLTPGQGPFQVKFHNNWPARSSGLAGTILAEKGESLADALARLGKTMPSPPAPPISEIAPNGYSFGGWYIKVGSTYQRFDVNDPIVAHTDIFAQWHIAPMVPVTLSPSTPKPAAPTPSTPRPTVVPTPSPATPTPNTPNTPRPTATPAPNPATLSPPLGGGGQSGGDGTGQISGSTTNTAGGGATNQSGGNTANQTSGNSQTVRQNTVAAQTQAQESAQLPDELQQSDLTPQYEESADSGYEEPTESAKEESDQIDRSAYNETYTDDDQTPLLDRIPLTQTGGEPTFALLNLILSVVCFLMALITTVKVLLRTHSEREEYIEATLRNEQYGEKSAHVRIFAITLTNIVGLAGIIILILTQTYPAYIIWLDNFTIYHAILFGISTLACVLALRKGNDGDSGTSLSKSPH